MTKKLPLVEGQIYHVFNRSINREPVFVNKKECQRALATLKYYLPLKTSIKFSRFLEWEEKRAQKYLENLDKKPGKKVSVFAFCFMPNHFHLLLKQLAPYGIRNYLSLFQNSFTRYFNTKNDRVGPIFQGGFKSVRVETDEQLIHLSRYIHLNPYSSYVVGSLSEVRKFPWSSLSEYLTDRDSLCDKREVMAFFDNNPKRYWKFVSDQANYQRRLEEIKHLMIED